MLILYVVMMHFTRPKNTLLFITCNAFYATAQSVFASQNGGPSSDSTGLTQ